MVAGQRKDVRAARGNARAEKTDGTETRAFGRGEKHAAEILRGPVHLRAGAHVEVDQMKDLGFRSFRFRRRRHHGARGGTHKVAPLHLASGADCSGEVTPGGNSMIRTLRKKILAP